MAGLDDWRGYLPAVPTPFAPDGALDVDAFAAVAGWMLAGGVHGLVVAGTLGEWHALDGDERDALTAAAVAVAGGTRPVLVGCTDFTPARVLAHVRRAAELGADGALVALPPYVRPSEREALAFYAAVAAGDLPICVYNWPPGTGVDLAPRALAEIARLDGVEAIKNSTSEPLRVAETITVVGDAAGVFGVPLDANGVHMVRAGARGTIGTGLLPDRQAAFFECCWAADEAGARAVGMADGELLRRWFTQDLTGRLGAAPAIIKAALRARGLPAGTVRAPLLDLDASAQAQVAADLAQLGIGPA